MEQIKNEFLEALCQLCPVVDAYKIIEYAEIKNNPLCSAMTISGIQKHLEVLNDNGYIIKRFSDDEEICLCVTGKTVRRVDDLIAERKRIEDEKKRQEEERILRETERLEREKREKDERDERERLAEAKRQEASELEKQIEQAKKELKKFGKDGTKTLDKLEENKALVEEELRELHVDTEVEPPAQAIESPIPITVPAVVDIPQLSEVSYKLIKNICKRSARSGAIIGGIIGSILTGGALVLVKFLLNLLT